MQSSLATFPLSCDSARLKELTLPVILLGRVLIMTPILFFFTSFIFVVPSVLAHGYVSQVSIDGKAYAGNVPNNYKGEPFSRS